MIHAENLIAILLLLANLTGLAIAAERFLGSWWLARAASPLIVVVPFFLEHFVGFGRLGWAWPLTTLASLWIIAAHRRLLRAHWRVELVYGGVFAYALAWRYAFPDITASSEKITDLTFVADYLDGARLPPVDRWLPPSPFDMYYSLQHYGEALIGRIFALPAGAAYNLGICILVACAATAAAGGAWLLTRRRGATLLLTLALLFGGTGVSPFIRLLLPAPQLYSSIRFLGSALSPENALTPAGAALARRSHVSKDSLDLPVELFSYLIGLGDDHPPLGGYLLLMLALAAIASIEAGEAIGPAHAILGVTIPLTIAVNAWDLPIQSFLIAAWLLYRAAAGKRIAWKPLATGLASALLLLQPFLARFAARSLALHNTLRFVPHSLHTPLLPALLVFYPVIAVLALHLICGERSKQSLAFCAIFLALAAASELLFVDDVYSGKYERFNTALKWWAWIYSATLLVIGALNLRSGSRICRAGTAAVLILICGFAPQLAANWWNPPKPHLGQLDGAAWLRDDPATRAMLAFLAAHAPAIVLQRISGRSYVAQPALTIFAGDIAFLGWANHEDIWRAYRPDIDQRAREVDDFYLGRNPDPVRWLEQNGVRYIVWSRNENSLKTFAAIAQRIQGAYLWREFSPQPREHAGIWCRLNAASFSGGRGITSARRFN